MEIHEYASLFPMATDAELRDMADDIRRRGLVCPIITLDGKILDGRNRFKACEIAEVIPFFETYNGSDPLADVVSWNLKRRHLSTSQKATLAVNLKPMFEEQARERMLAGKAADPRADLPEGSKGKAIDKAAAAVGVSGRIVQDAEHVKKHAPEVFEEVKAGRMTVNAAKQEVSKRESQQGESKAIDPVGNTTRPHSDEVYTSETMAGLKRYWKKATKKERIEFKEWAKI